MKKKYRGKERGKRKRQIITEQIGKYQIGGGKKETKKIIVDSRLMDNRGRWCNGMWTGIAKSKYRKESTEFL